MTCLSLRSKRPILLGPSGPAYLDGLRDMLHQFYVLPVVCGLITSRASACTRRGQSPLTINVKRPSVR